MHVDRFYGPGLDVLADGYIGLDQLRENFVASLEFLYMDNNCYGLTGSRSAVPKISVLPRCCEACSSISSER